MGTSFGRIGLCVVSFVCFAWLMRHTQDGFAHAFQRPSHLPPLKCTASTFVRINGCEYVFLFGGYNAEEAVSAVSAEIVAIDVRTRLWMYVPAVGVIAARLDAAIVFVPSVGGGRLYVFGGRKGFSDDDEKEPGIRAYSVAEYGKDGEWRWVICDAAYPSDVPDMGYAGAALLVDGGERIVLTAGRLQGGASVRLVQLLCPDCISRLRSQST